MAKVNPEPESPKSPSKVLDYLAGTEDSGANIPEKTEVELPTTQMRFGNSGPWARIAYNPIFESVTMGVITFNALWIGIDTEWNHVKKKQNGKLPLEPAAIVIENFFCIYFTGEVLIRFLAFAVKKMCVYDAWFVFDSVLVACMIFETWLMPIVTAIMASDSGAGVGPLSALRLLRLLRLARVGRLMRFVPELGKLIKGMVKAAKSVVFILIFLVLVIYVFAIIFTGSLSDRTTFPLTPYCSRETARGANNTDDCLEDGDFGPLAQDLFATMGDSFMSLFTRGVLADNLDETVAAILDESLILMWLFMIFLIITFATLLNMLIGVVCEVISDAAAEEEEIETVSGLKETIEAAFSQIDSNADGLVSQVEWSVIKDNARVRKSMMTIGIEDERMEERLGQMEEMIFNDQTDGDHQDIFRPPGDDFHTGLTLQELIQKVVEIRPDQNASALDLELLKGQVLKDQKLFKWKLKKIEEAIKKVLGPGVGVDDDIPNMPGMPGMPGAPPASNAIEDEIEFQPPIKLVDVPMQMLFRALKERQDASDLRLIPA